MPAPSGASTSADQNVGHVLEVLAVGIARIIVGMFSGIAVPFLRFSKEHFFARPLAIWIECLVVSRSHGKRRALPPSTGGVLLGRKVVGLTLLHVLFCEVIHCNSGCACTPGRIRTHASRGFGDLGSGQAELRTCVVDFLNCRPYIVF